MSRRREAATVRLTRIYTRGGDQGETSLGDGTRVAKLDPLVAALGTVDELNAQLGLVRACTDDEGLAAIQNELFDLGADLCVPYDAADGRLRVGERAVARLESECDRVNAGLPELTSFVLPGGSEAGARLHLARAVCRRAERDVLAAARERPLNPLVGVYLNRLSDLLFILARAANAGAEEPLWRPGSTTA